ncbi:MAG: PQQ-dependent sugar dehydrogenase [Alphaproteobacteria bacterium]|nr:PQQ-dependent sugar dehydrogenase [Alphaproteobacteria bacterium]
MGSERTVRTAGAGLALLAILMAPAGVAAADITVPDGFTIGVFHEGVGPARQIAAGPDGTLYVKLRGAGLVALRDADGDGRAEGMERFGDMAGTGVGVHAGWLYASSDTAVYRWALPEAGGAPEGAPQTVIEGFPDQRQHAAKAFAFTPEGRIIVNVGAPSNACQQTMRTPGSPGLLPCPQLERQAGLWAFPADADGLQQMAGERIATGTRNVLALATHPATGVVHFVQHGRDQLDTLWPDHYDAEDNAELPAEEMHRLDPGTDYGWPYTYWDGRAGVRRIAPEYGGDGEKTAPAGKYPDPQVAFPAHWAPNQMAFYDAEAFPERYRGGAFVAFHGSWNRAPKPQAGYLVAFVPFADGVPAGGYERFADGFAGAADIARPNQADHRAMGVAVGPDGALYISDSREGRIWRVTWTGEG